MSPSHHGTPRGDAPWRQGARPSGRRPPPRKGGGRPAPKRRRRRGGWGIFKFLVASSALGVLALAMLVGYYAAGLPPTDQLFWAGYSGVLYLPSTVGPIGLTGRSKLPVGYQAIARHGHDKTAIAFSRAVEREIGGFVAPEGY